MVKQRLSFIDVFKGVLIILVILHHAPLVCSKFGNPYMDTFWINNFIIAFFMPAWFIATGYCSNFTKPFHLFLWQNFKGIMIPCFTLYCINHFLSCINAYFYGDSLWMSLSHWFNPGIRTFLRTGGFYWFLSSLFLSKILFWGIAKIPNDIYKLSICVMMLVAGLCLYNITSDHNFFYYQHSLILTFFLFAGQQLKKHENRLLSHIIPIAVSFILIVIVISYMKITVPTVTREITVTLSTSPLFVLLSILGSLTTWAVSKRIAQCNLLEYMGKGSLVIYAFNYVTLTIVANTLVYIIAPNSAFLSVACFVLTIILSLAVLTLFYWLIDKKWIKAIIGKF